MPLGSFVVANGNITASITSNALVGINTTFLTNLSSGAAIANASNVFVGYVSYISSNTSLILRANANVAVSSSETFQYAPFIANVETYTYNVIGNITCNTTTNLLFGNNTAFISNVNVGDKIYLANGNPNVSVDTKIGHVALIIDDFSLMLTGPATANVDNRQFYTSSKDFILNPINGVVLDNDYNQGRKFLDAALFDWAYSGIGSSVSYVHKYHPPVRDSVTGILVHLPATVFENNSPVPGYIDRISGRLVGNVTVSTDIIDSYSPGSSGVAQSGKNYSIVDFDQHDYPFGSDVSHVHKSLYNSRTIKKLAQTDDESKYIDGIKSVIPNTVVSKFAETINANIKLVTDSLSEAKSYFGRVGKTEELRQQGGINFGHNQDISLRPMPMELKGVVSTGAPIAIPGLLNIKVVSAEPVDTKWVPYNYVPELYGALNPVVANVGGNL